MAGIDISKLFSDITGPANTDLAEGQARVDAMGVSGGMAALLSPQRSRAMRQGLGGIFGEEAGVGMTPQERIPEAMRGLDIKDPNSIAQVIRKLNAVGATQEAAQLKLGLDQLLAENANEAAKLLVEQGELKVKQREATTGEKQVIVNETNAATQQGQAAQEVLQFGQDQAEHLEEVRQYNLDRNAPDMSDISIANATPQSVTEYLLAHRAATDDAGRDKAYALLRARPLNGWVYKKDGDKLDDNGNQAYYQYPAGAERERIQTLTNARISAGQQMKRASANVVGIMDKMIEKVVSGEVSTGFAGIAWSIVPGSKNYSFNGDLSVVLANLGYDGLMNAKSSSDSGASGFGQLTEKELKLLQSLDRDLAIGIQKEELIERLNAVQASFQYRMDTAKTNWSIDEVIGRVPPNFPEAPDTTAPVAVESQDGDIADGANGEVYVLTNGIWVLQ